MGKQESSFYVIHKPDDAFDRAWASAAATPTPPKPDEGLWTDRKHAATYEGNGWVNVVVNPDPNKLPGSRAGQLFAFEITANESLAPMRFTTRLRGEVVTSMPASTSREGNLSGEKGEAPKDEQHRHQLLLDSPVIEMTYLGKRARTLDDPVSNPFRQTYLLPKRALCSCGSTLLLPSSCADGRVQIRYWFEIVGQRLNSSESRLRWKGKNRLPDMDERHSAKVLAIPVRITAERYSPRYIPSPDDLAMAGTSRNEPPVSVSQRGDETLTTRYFLEDERPKLAGFDVSSLKLVYRITTPNEGPASLHVRLEVSLGIYQDGPRYRELCDSFAKTHLSVTFHLVRQTMIVPPAPTPAPEPEDRKGKGKAKAKSTSLPHGVAVSPFVESDTFGAPLQIDKPYISTDLRLVGPPGVKERAQELFLKFDGDLVLACGVTVDAKTRESELQSALPSRVQACNAEVRYDLVADLTDPSAPSTSSIRAQDVRIDLPASLLTGLQQQSRPSVPTQTSETFPTRMLSIAREAGLVNPTVDFIVLSVAGGG
ncbi:hypothetical protein B0A53_04711 [Rhodotorula sp. CCFEE 5036]|nr:hypothetical protein B0A53_04711 [Rhodotorula sp. CCFEE 5036]